MAFKAVIPQPIFKALLNAIAETVDEARFRLSAEGIQIDSVDPANVQLTHVFIPAAAFDFYKAEPGVLGVDVIRLEDMISGGDGEDNVTLEVGTEQAQLYVGMGRLKWTLSLISPEAIRKEPRLPEIDLPAMAKLSGKELSKIIKAADKITDHLRIVMEENRLIFKAKGDMEHVSSTIEESDLMEMKFSPANSLFMLEYLKGMAKAAKDSQEVKIEFGTDYPMRMTYHLGGAQAPIEISYVLAPRVEVD